MRGERMCAASAAPTREASPVNIHATAAAGPTAAISPAEWETRVDLAAVYRLVAHHGWDDVIYKDARDHNKSAQATTFFGSLPS
jgi:hypothetical protein